MLKKLKEVNYGSLATVVGRYYAMDRDKRWERIKIAYEALVQGIGETTTPDKVIEVYKKNVPYMSVNVFSMKVLIEVTIFMSPTWRRNRHFTWFLSHMKV